MQDIEFTVENNKLWMLQTRSGKRTAKAAIKIAVDMVKEKLISNKEAVLRVDPNILDTLLHPTLDEKAEKKIIASGLASISRSRKWKSYFFCRWGRKIKRTNARYILVRIETSPEDINGMHAAKVFLLQEGEWLVMQLLLLEEWENLVFLDQVKLKLIMKINYLNQENTCKLKKVNYYYRWWKWKSYAWKSSNS